MKIGTSASGLRGLLEKPPTKRAESCSVLAEKKANKAAITIMATATTSSKIDVSLGMKKRIQLLRIGTQITVVKQQQ